MRIVFSSRFGSVRCSILCGGCCQAVDAQGATLTGDRLVPLAAAFRALAQVAGTARVS